MKNRNRVGAPEIVRRYGLDRATLWRWRKEKGLTFHRDFQSGRIYFDPKEVEEFIKREYSPAAIERRFKI